MIFTTKPDKTGIDIYLGIGAAPEGVLAAGALRCIGGQMQGRLILDTEEKRTRAAGMGVKDPNRKYDMSEMARGDVIVAATGVTDGALLKGVRFGKDVIETETVVYRSATGTVRRIHGRAPRVREVPSRLRVRADVSTSRSAPFAPTSAPPGSRSGRAISPSTRPR